MNIDYYIAKLVQYGIDTGLIPEEEKIYSTNQILEVLHKDDYEAPTGAGASSGEGEQSAAAEDDVGPAQLPDILDHLLDYAFETGLLADNGTASRDLFDTKLMNCIVPRPIDVIWAFWENYDVSPQTATDVYFRLSQDSNYIRRDRIARDHKWKTPSEYGEIDITINLSKPEKDPKAIAAAKDAKPSGYPKCQLCLENEGYAGRPDHPARQNLRIVPITICGSPWGFQYSPYAYYNEHCIVINSEHIPMKIDRETFRKLFDFIRQFPHYFMGSNADLPIVGGSILSHDHFQGGRYTFAMERAEYEQSFTVPGFEDVESGIVHWPLSVIRVRGADAERVVDLADYILGKWRGYTDEEAFLFSETDGKPHNTITPIARMRDGLFELDLALRNNITTDAYPLGVFHPHPELFHIKKENIGLIEVMGLAVLPPRLQTEMEEMARQILAGGDLRENEMLEKHADWYDGFKDAYTFTEENVTEILEQEIGKEFVRVLEDAGVFKRTPEGREAFKRFIDTLYKF